MNDGFATSWRVRGGMLAAALARAESFLLEAPVPSDATATRLVHTPLVVAVVPLVGRCGTTTVARGVGALLAARHDSGAAIVSGSTDNLAFSMPSPVAARLTRSVGEQVDAVPRVGGRLCLLDCDARIARAQALRHEVPLVIDVSHGSDPSEAASLADVTVLVAAGETQPALAAVVGASLARSGPEPLLVVSRASTQEDDLWADRPVHRLVDAKFASRIALAGREAPGVLGDALGELVDRFDEVLR
jgi:hypothetical protein